MKFMFFNGYVTKFYNITVDFSTIHGKFLVFIFDQLLLSLFAIVAIVKQ